MRTVTASLTALALMAGAVPAFAQATPPTQSPPIASTAPAAEARGLRPADVAAWLTQAGGEVTGPETDPAGQYLVVQDGQLRWVVFFYGCNGETCSDMQFGASFSDGAISLDAVNAWNRDKRFLKAHYVPADAENPQATALVRFDVFFQPGQGVDQLADYTYIWISMLPDFARAMGMAAPAQGQAPTQ